MPTAFSRKNIRLPHNSYTGQTICFATLCFHERRAFACDPAIATWLVNALRTRASRESFLIHAYCVMPDHLHFLVEATLPTCDTLSLVSQFKQHTGYKFAQRKHLRLWQPKWYDHLIRANDSIEAVCWYIWMNPVRRQLCQRPTDYPFLGSFSDCASRLNNCSPNLTWQPPWKVPG